MYRLEREQFLRAPNIWLWITLAFQAGFVNAFGFVACGRYVSHVTGFGTQIGVMVAERRFLGAAELLGFPLSFIMGAFFSGLLTSARLERNLKPLYGQVILMFPLILASLMYLGNNGLFGAFGDVQLQSRDLFLLFLLSFFCGMQNGCFATMTRGQIRTTHLTGISTDLGTDLARMWKGNLGLKEYGLTLRTNVSRFATILAFAFGSVVSVSVSESFGYLALAVPLVTSAGVFFAVDRIRRKLDRMYSLKTQRSLRVMKPEEVA